MVELYDSIRLMQSYMIEFWFERSIDQQCMANYVFLGFLGEPLLEKINFLRVAPLEKKMIKRTWKSEFANPDKSQPGES